MYGCGVGEFSVSDARFDLFNFRRSRAALETVVTQHYALDALAFQASRVPSLIFGLRYTVLCLVVLCAFCRFSQPSLRSSRNRHVRDGYRVSARGVGEFRCFDFGFEFSIFLTQSPDSHKTTASRLQTVCACVSWVRFELRLTCVSALRVLRRRDTRH